MEGFEMLNSVNKSAHRPYSSSVASFTNCLIEYYNFHL